MHHCVLLVVERVEYLDCVETPHCFYPDMLNRFVESDYAPVGCVVGDNSGKVVFTIHELYSRLDIVFVVNTYHHACLVKADFVIAGYFDLRFKFASILGIVKRWVINCESIVGDSPVIALGSHCHGQFVCAY